MFQPLKISPSILSANFMSLGNDIELIEGAGADWVHVDVMDGHFVPNITIGIPHVRQLKAATALPLDVHLMVANPCDQVPWFLQMGADIVTFHAEAVDEQQMRSLVSLIHEAGAKAAVAVKPKTDLAVLKPVIADLDMVLVMSVEPGFSGQSYIEGSDERIAQVVNMAREVGNDGLLIEVDGGIGPGTVELVAQAGADVIVCGNAVFAQSDPAVAIELIRSAGDAARASALVAVGSQMD